MLYATLAIIIDITNEKLLIPCLRSRILLLLESHEAMTSVTSNSSMTNSTMADSTTVSGLFRPPYFREYAASEFYLKLAAIAFGFQLGYFVLTFSKVLHQVWAIYQRRHWCTPYAVMILFEVLINITFSILSFLLINGSVRGSFWYFLFQITLLNIELHLLVQIIINRISLLITSTSWARKIKWAAIVYVLILNIGLYIFAIPAQLQWMAPWYRGNEVWQQLEKGLICFMDIWLNWYFVYLIKTKLMVGGAASTMAEKWRPLYRYSIPMAISNVLIDFLLLGSTAKITQENFLLTLQFYPLFYMIKLNIELSMASMVGQVAKTAFAPRIGGVDRSAHILSLGSTHNNDFLDVERRGSEDSA
ncbi:hypothetical protein LTR66_016663, partial [Elasticomyces elasticus]